MIKVLYESTIPYDRYDHPYRIIWDGNYVFCQVLNTSGKGPWTEWIEGAGYLNNDQWDDAMFSTIEDLIKENEKLIKELEKIKIDREVKYWNKFISERKRNG